MLMLPDELFWGVIRRACFDNDNLPVVAGQIECYQFWPHWDHSGTINSVFVEPDIYIQFQTLDLIIEAKKDGNSNGQYYQQWEKEIRAYHNKSINEKPVYFIAVGGNADKAAASVTVGKNVIVNKCTWLSLLIQITRLRDEYDSLSMISNSHSALIRLLNLIELAFNVHGVYNIRWFDEIATTKPLISPDSIMTFKTYFK